MRAEGQESPTFRYLLPANEFHRRRRGQLWRFALIARDHSYFAGIWRLATRDWPESYAVLTTEANGDVSPYHDDQMAVILRCDRMAWLDHATPNADLLSPLPAGTFQAQADGAPPTLL